MDRCARLLAELKRVGKDAALVHRPENMALPHRLHRRGLRVPLRRECAIITDFRYVEQAGRQAPDMHVVSTDAAHRESARVLELTDAHAVRTLAVERDYLSYDQHEALRAALPFVKLAGLDSLPEALRLIKDAGEIESIRKSAAIASRAFENILGRIRPGMTEKQVQIMLDYEMLSLGSEGNAFDTIAAAGVNGSLPHAIPSDYALQKGDLLTLDFGAKVDGYCSDMTRTVAIGKPAPRAARDLRTGARRAHGFARSGASGRKVRDADKIARDMIDARTPRVRAQPGPRRRTLHPRTAPGRLGIADGASARLCDHDRARRIYPRTRRMPDRGHGDTDFGRLHRPCHRPEAAHRAVTTYTF